MQYSNSEREQIVEHILFQLKDDIAGDNINALIDLSPSEKFFVGCICPKPKSDELNKGLQRIMPTDIGFEFLVLPDYDKTARIKIQAKGKYFYRVFPTYKEQVDVADDSQARATIRKKYASKSLDYEKEIRLQDIISGTVKDIDLTKECEALWGEATLDKSFFSRFGRAANSISHEDLSSEDSYLESLKQNNKEFGCPWKLKINFRVFVEKDGIRISAALSNSSFAIEDNLEKKIIDNKLYCSKLCIGIKGNKFQKFPLKYIEKNYMHSREIAAVGINCSAFFENDNLISTECLPCFNEERNFPKEFEGVSFDVLLEDTIGSLKRLHKEISGSYSSFEKSFSKEVKGQEDKREFEEDLRKIKFESERMQSGIDVLSTNENALKAFKLMVKSFKESKKAYAAWKPFQLTFIVSLVPDILAAYDKGIQSNRHKVDLLYFPTGGGKTEAFLGVAIFQAFVDRFYGKKAGVSIITKFPLRMLSLQQLQRIADIFLSAEKIRQGENAINSPDMATFGVGYFIGSKGTINSYKEWSSELGRYVSKLERIKEDEAVLQKHKVIEECPYCGKKSIQVKVIDKEGRLALVCNNGCGILPIYVTDEDVYRYLPTLVIATLDKIAVMGMQINFRNMLGQIKGKCKKHGFSSSTKCTFKSCEQDIEQIDENIDYSPSLLIQDEMHLVRDAFGTFDSHYETAIDRLIEDVSGGKKLKIIAATATVSLKKHEQQIKNLYCRETIKFPANLKVFTEGKQEISRKIIGVLPISASFTKATQDIIVSIKRAIDRLSKQNNGNEKLLEELLDFESMLSYHNKKDDANRLNRSVDTMINVNLRESGNKEVVRAVLTGDRGMDEIRHIMEKTKCPMDEDFYNMIIATSIISHGVDISLLNTMIFMGVPPNNAEYIQALSRIGRNKTGLVIVVFNPMKERDRSYYKYFLPFHQHSDLLVEGQPVQRWSLRAIERTMPGIFGASMLCKYDLQCQETIEGLEKLSMVSNFRKAYNHPYKGRNLLNEADVSKFIIECYKTNLANEEEKVNSVISELVSNQFNSILNSDCNEKITPINMVMRPMPMKSLRDTEVNLDIKLTTDSYSVMRNPILRQGNSK
jgi:hypothetical protein